MSGFDFSNKKFLVPVLVLLAIVCAGGWYLYHQAKPAPIPAALSLPIPSTTQAPDGNWTNNENCEEASAIMVNAFLSGSKEDKLAAALVQEQIASLVSWEQANLGFNANTGADDTAKMIEAVFHLRTSRVNNFTEQDLKIELARQHPVILFINAKQLHNPYYNQLGPTYHVFVVRGYSAAGFIVNDPGVNGGESNVYSFDILKSAAADWDSAAKVLSPDNKVALAVFN